MSEQRQKCMKTTAIRPCNFEAGGSSSAAGGRTAARRDPYYSSSLQASRLTKFQGRKLAYVRYVDVSLLVEQGFQFSHQLEVRGTNTFVKLNGKLYPSLIREYYNNFQFKDGVYMTMVKGKIIVLNEELFLAVGGLSSSGSPLGDCENEQWESFDVVDMYKSCLRWPHYFVLGELTKVGSLTVESCLLHYVIAYILIQCNTNHAQPTINDLKLLFAIREGILVNRPAEILKVMFGIATSSHRLLPYDIFISRIIDHVEIDTSDIDFHLTNTRDHLLDEHMIHKMGIYWFIVHWMYQEDYKITVDLDLSDEENPVTEPEQPDTHAPQASPYGLAHLDSMEQRQNQRIDAVFQAMNDIMDYGSMSLYDRVAAYIQREA
ncbi:hypothetical protein Lal_00008506 [Lupinus albus]|nr:hypothetical protein Lal_00008506 [Lupinus albus]